MAHHEVCVEVLGPWSLATSRDFWEGFAPAAPARCGCAGTALPTLPPRTLRPVFCVEGGWPARLRDSLVRRHGDDGAFPPPLVLRDLDLDLPGRKAEYLRAVADAALDGPLDGTFLRSLDPAGAVDAVRQVKGLGPFAAELVVVRGANAPDVAPRHERRLDAEVVERYGPGCTLAEVSQARRPFRTWAAVHLRSLREERTHEIGGRRTRDG